MKITEKKVVNATGWSFVTEIAAKLIAPITSMVLARLLAPEVFGVVATITMVTSFAELIAEAGFHRYIIQNSYSDDTEKWNCITVAFWTNLIFSLLIWLIIILFRNGIAYSVGADGMGNVIAIAAVNIPLMAFSSIQMAVFKRELKFKTLFFIRIISCFVPLFVTVPLAYFYRNYWALIIGSMALNVINAIVLAVCSNWRPKLFFDFKMLKNMLSFSIWSSFEQFSVWLTANIGIFLVGRTFSNYYTGLYKVIITTVNQTMGLISSAIIPVAFAALSRCEEKSDFSAMYYKFERSMGIFLIPMSFGILLFNKFATAILLGSQWKEASIYMGLWGFARGFVLVLGSLSSEAFKAKGKPRTAFTSQTIYLAFLIPAIYLSAKKGFASLMVIQSAVSFTYIIIQCVFLRYAIKISPAEAIKNVLSYTAAATAMTLCGMVIKHVTPSATYMDIINIIVCIIVYFSILMLFKRERKEVKALIGTMIRKG